MKIEIIKWEEYNARREKDLKSMNWFRLETDMPFNPKMFDLSINAKWFFICLLCVCAKKMSGIIEVSDNYLSHVSCVPVEEVPVILSSLSSCGLICTEPVPDLTEITPLHNITNITNKHNKHNTTQQPPKVFNPDIVRLTQLLYDLIMANANPTRYRNNPPDLEKWSKDIDLLYRVDGASLDLIEKIIRFATKDSFWRGNILSGSKLREKFNTLEQQYNRPSRERKQTTREEAEEYIKLTGDQK